jgi:hypothetical protein
MTQLKGNYTVTNEMLESKPLVLKMKPTIPSTPAIAGLSFRFTSGKADYATLAEICRLVMAADQIVLTMTVERLPSGLDLARTSTRTANW